MTTTHPSTDDSQVATGHEAEVPTPEKTHRKRGKRLVLLMIIAGITGFILSRRRGTYDYDSENDDGI